MTDLSGLKAITLTQPYASLMARQKKVIETRSWYTSHRGPTVIHAAKGFPAWARNLVADDARFSIALETDRPDELPLSCAVCVVDIVGCVLTEDIHKAELVLGQKPSIHEIVFGDFRPGRYAWLTKFICALPNVGPVKGSLGLWKWDHTEQERIKRILEPREELFT